MIWANTIRKSPNRKLNCVLCLNTNNNNNDNKRSIREKMTIFFFVGFVGEFSSTNTTTRLHCFTSINLSNVNIMVCRHDTQKKKTKKNCVNSLFKYMRSQWSPWIYSQYRSQMLIFFSSSLLLLFSNAEKEFHRAADC